MSNDSKFWLARGLLAACIVIEISLLAGIKSAVMDPAHPHLKLTVALFVIILVLSLPALMHYYAAKSRRWEGSRPDQDKIAVETLAKLGEKHAQQRERNKNNNI